MVLIKKKKKTYPFVLTEDHSSEISHDALLYVKTSSRLSFVMDGISLFKSNSHPPNILPFIDGK